jgi:hypothetical protein
MSLSFPKWGQNRGAALLSRAGRPRPACPVVNTVEQADKDVDRGQGRPPHKTKRHRVVNPRPIGKEHAQ